MHEETGSFEMWERNDKGQLEKIATVEDGSKFFNIETEVQQQNLLKQEQVQNKSFELDR